MNAYTKQLQKFYQAVEQTVDSIFITNTKGVIEYVNPAFEKITGYKKREALGKTPKLVKSGMQSKEHYHKLWSTILSGKPFRATVVNRRKNGTLFYADHTITPIKDQKGVVSHFVGIWKDITQQVEFEKRMEEFLAIASHELKTPLTVIKAYMQVFEKDPNLKNEKKRFLVEQVDSQIDKITKLIEDFLDVAIIETGKIVPDKKWLGLDELIKDTINDFQLTTAHKIIKKGWTKRKVFGNEQRLSQVLINLLSNASKYSPLHTKVVVRVKSQLNQVIVSVEDCGLGIPKKNIPFVFDRFFRSNPQNDKVSGFGLGLYICSEIIKSHDGKIWVESQRGKGSTFHFSLPAE